VASFPLSIGAESLAGLADDKLLPALASDPNHVRIEGAFQVKKMG